MEPTEITLSIIIVMLLVINYLQAMMLRHNKTIIRMMKNEVKDHAAKLAARSERQEFF